MPSFYNIKSSVFPWHLHPIQLYSLAQEQGISEHKLLTASDLSREQLADDNLKINWHQYRALAECLEQQTRDPQWGLKLGQRLGLTSHGLLSLAVMSCEDMHQALDLVIRFKNLVTALFSIDVKLTEELVILQCSPEISRDNLMRPFTECFFLGLCQGFAQLVNYSQTTKTTIAAQPLAIDVYFQRSKPNHAEQLLQHFPGRVFFDTPGDQLRFPRQLLDLKIDQANHVTVASMAERFESQIKLYQSEHGMLTLLRQQFKAGNHSLERCADYFNTSATTLKRYLQQADTSFNRELNLYRFNEACHLLEFSNQDQEDIAISLGYSEVSSFRRAFKQWSGQTPVQYQQQPYYLSQWPTTATALDHTGK